MSWKPLELAQGEHKREATQLHSRWESSLRTKIPNALAPLMKNVLTALQVGESYLEDYQEIFKPFMTDRIPWIQPISIDITVLND